MVLVSIDTFSYFRELMNVLQTFQAPRFDSILRKSSPYIEARTISSSSCISSYWDFGAGDFGTASADLLGFNSGKPEEVVLRCGGFVPHGLVGGMMLSVRLKKMATQKISSRTRSRSYVSFTRLGCTFQSKLKIMAFKVSVDVGQSQPFILTLPPRGCTKPL